MLVRFTFPRRSCLVPHSSQLLYLLFSLPRNVCSFSEVWIKCSLFSKVSSRSSPLVREGGLDFSLICDPIKKKKKYIYIYQFSSVQLLSHVRLFATPWITARQASLSITNSRNLLKLTSIESVMPSSHLILCRPLLLLPKIPPSIRVFSNESTLRMRWPKYWSFSFSISPSNEHPGLISFRMDWLDLLADQGTRKSLLRHHSSKALSLLHSPTLTSIHDHRKNHSLD